MKFPGIMSGKVFKGTNPNKEGVQYGPNTSELPPHPLEELTKKIVQNSENFYEPTGHINCRQDKIEYLKS